MHDHLRAVLAALALASSSSAIAAPCTSGTLASYFGLADACEVGNLSFSGFQAVETPTAATTIGADAIHVAPLEGTNGLAFTLASPLAAGAGTLFEIVFAFQVSALGGTALTGNALGFLGTYDLAGDSSVTGVEDTCLGGTFSSPPGGCSGIPASLIVFDLGLDADLAESLAFPSVDAAAIVVDIGLDGGLDGSVSADAGFGLALGFDTQQVPEPSLLALLAASLLAPPILRRGVSRPRRR